MPVMAWPFIEIRDDGVAMIYGTQTKVIEIALDRIAHHWDVDEIQRQYPYLSLGQIHAALGYYFENRLECDRLIDQHLRELDELRSRLENPVLKARLQAAKRGA